MRSLDRESESILSPRRKGERSEASTIWTLVIDPSPTTAPLPYSNSFLDTKKRVNENIPVKQMTNRAASESGLVSQSAKVEAKPAPKPAKPAPKPASVTTKAVSKLAELKLPAAVAASMSKQWPFTVPAHLIRTWALGNETLDVPDRITGDYDGHVFICEYCGKICNFLSGLRYHEKREHDVIHATAPRPKASKSKSKSKHKYPCQVPGCVKIYNSLPGIRGHYQTGHTEEERALLPKGDAKKGGVERDSSLALGVQDLQDGEDSEMSDSD